MRLTPVLSLLIVMTLCAGCCRHQPAPDYSWVQPIHFHPETVEWFRLQEKPPPTLFIDLEKVRKHNQKVEAIQPH